MKNLIHYTAILLFTTLTANASIVSLPPINESSRINQAKEILGSKNYKKGAASKAKDKKYINLRIYHLLNARLPKKYKNKAQSLTKKIIQLSEKNNLDPIFILAIIKTESSYNPDAIGTSGEVGLMQLMPDTAEWLATKFNMKFKSVKQLHDPVMNVTLGISYFAMLRDDFSKNSSHYISAYNVGPNKLKKMVQLEQPPAIYKEKVYANYQKIYEDIISIKI